ncbi:MAG TPA: alpha/beta fold hydrolase [Candidatus Binatia bacterium]|nr:alpha/beta fold hydrolase [Candidatus Binatia bacterium]
MPNPTQSRQAPISKAVTDLPGAEERTITLNGVNWRYWFAGSGPALLLIHGFMGYSFSWRFNVEPLSRHFSVYAIDLPGCGFSQRTQATECSLACDAEAVLDFMEHLGITNADLVGSSRGAGLAIILAAIASRTNRSHRLRRLVLVSPINPWSSHGQLLTRLLATSLGGLYVVHVQPRLPVIARRYFRSLYGDVRRISPGTFEGYTAGLTTKGSFEHLFCILRSWRADLATIGDSLDAASGIPSLLLWGSRDRAVYPSSIHQLQRHLRNSALVMFPGAGHLPYEEVPQEFNRVLCDFLLHDTPAIPLAIAAGEKTAIGS